MNDRELDWPHYLAHGPPKLLYHMCDSAVFSSSITDSELYYPPTFSSEGFIHATENPSFLLNIGNQFYQQDKGKWICLKINPHRIEAKVVYEAIGNVEERKNGDLPPKCPHIYGGIPLESIVAAAPIVRDDDGNFLSITGITTSK